MTGSTTHQDAWRTYKERELALLVPVLTNHGYTLDPEQPHIIGERFLMQAVTTASGKKLILLGTSATGERVVIKATSDSAGIREIRHEEACRSMLHRMNFAYGTFESPEMLESFTKDGQYVTVQRFIEQECSFLERPIETQFAIALRAFKAQESAHATTHRHIKLIRRVFESYDAARYVSSAREFANYIHHHATDTALALLQTHALETLTSDTDAIERYTGFLTHTDFVPHNIRVQDDTIYLLDHSSLRFGNKHEGWARFMNFMTLYNPALEQAFETYVEQNRAPEEVQSLWLMRVYRLSELIRYYTHTTLASTGDLQELNRARVLFWADVLRALLDHVPLDDNVRATYIATRDRLRSEDEKVRQKGLH